MRGFIAELWASYSEEQRFFLFWPFFLFVYTLLFGGLGLLPLYTRLDGIQTQGVVVDFQGCSDSGGDAMIAPLLAWDNGDSLSAVVQFTDLAGQTHQVVQADCGGYTLGQRVTVWYLPESIDASATLDLAPLGTSPILSIFNELWGWLSIPLAICLVMIWSRVFKLWQQRFLRRAAAKAGGSQERPRRKERLAAVEVIRSDGPPRMMPGVRIDERAVKFALAVLLICLVMAGGVATATLWGLGTFWYPRVVGVQATATVIGAQQCPGSAGQRITVQFTDTQNRRHDISPNVCFADTYHTDQHVVLWYLPTSLDQVTIRGNNDTGVLIESPILVLSSLFVVLVWMGALVNLIRTLRSPKSPARRKSS